MSGTSSYGLFDQPKSGGTALGHSCQRFGQHHVGGLLEQSEIVEATVRSPPSADPSAALGLVVGASFHYAGRAMRPFTSGRVEKGKK